MKQLTCIAVAAAMAGSAPAVTIYNNTPDYSQGIFGWTSHGVGFGTDVWRGFTPVSPAVDTYLTRLDFFAWYIPFDPSQRVSPAEASTGFEIATWEDGENNVPYGVANTPFFADTGRTYIPRSNASVSFVASYGSGWDLYRIGIDLPVGTLANFGNEGLLKGGVRNWVSVTSIGNWDKGFMAMVSGNPTNNPLISRQNYFNGDLNTWNQFNYHPGFHISMQGSPVPEPASMIALGIGALALVRKRRSSK